MTEAFRLAEASLVAPFRYSSMLWAMIVGVVVFGDWPGPSMLAGAALVVGSGLYILHREARRVKEPRHAAQGVALTEFSLASRRETGLLLQRLHSEIAIALPAVRQESCELQRYERSAPACIETADWNFA